MLISTCLPKSSFGIKDDLGIHSVVIKEVTDIDLVQILF